MFNQQQSFRLLKQHYLIYSPLFIQLIYYMQNNHKLGFEKQPNIKQMTNEELKILLSKLQDQHDVLEATNQELTIQISDLRNAVKCVEAQRKENVTYQIQKKKQLQSKIESLEKGLKYANKNNPSNTMEQYKSLME